jgi:hypothetical protein
VGLPVLRGLFASWVRPLIRRWRGTVTGRREVARVSSRSARFVGACGSAGAGVAGSRAAGRVGNGSSNPHRVNKLVAPSRSTPLPAPPPLCEFRCEYRAILARFAPPGYDTDAQKIAWLQHVVVSGFSWRAALDHGVRGVTLLIPAQHRLASVEMFVWPPFDFTGPPPVRLVRPPATVADDGEIEAAQACAPITVRDLTPACLR